MTTTSRQFTRCRTCQHRYEFTGIKPPPCPKCNPVRPAGASVGSKGISIPPADANEQVNEALELCDEIDSLAEDVPSAGEEFASSVCERANDIRATIMGRNFVTDGQMSALENMRDGLSRWIR
jgi:hypothetical protein